MIHIVFNENEVELLKQVIELDESLQGDVIQIKDDFAVGPIQNIYETEGYQARREWWTVLLANTPYEKSIDLVDDKMTVHQLKEKLAANTDEQCWIWMAQNQHDVSGYYWLMPQLREFQGRIMVLYMNNLPFLNEKGQLFYPTWLSEIPAKEFLKAKKLARPITLSEFEVDPDEWKKLGEQNAMVRMLEGGKKLAGKEEDFYDAEIVKNLTKDWQKSTRVLSNTLNRMKIKTGDVFLMWRMKELISAGKIESMGDLEKGWKDVDLRLMGAGPVETNANQEATAN